MNEILSGALSKYCSSLKSLNPTSIKAIKRYTTDPPLPVNNNTLMTLFCSKGYTNMEHDHSTAVCIDGSVDRTSSKLPSCKSELFHAGSLIN
jgi:hypothetical protein